MPFKYVPATLALFLMAPAPASADPAFGFGITVLTNGDAAIGLRVFSNNRRGKAAVSFGTDYKLETESFRPAIGAAYLDRSFYIDATVGIDLQSNELDFGLGAGKLWNSRGAAAPPVVPATPTTPTPTPPTPTGGTDLPS